MTDLQCRLLIVDDNETVRSLVTDHFSKIGCSVIEARDGIEGLQEAVKARADCIILDVMMPGMDGFSVCRFLRERGSTTPIIMLTDRIAIDDKVTGFQEGADDYLAKPFSPVELEMRVRALLRRRTSAPAPAAKKGTVARGRLRIDFERRTASVDGELVELTPIEFNILKLLAGAPGRVYTRDELLNVIWDTTYDGYKRNIDPHINRLRTKIEQDPKHPALIRTVWGVGYKFAEK